MSLQARRIVIGILLLLTIGLVAASIYVGLSLQNDGSAQDSSASVACIGGSCIDGSEFGPDCSAPQGSCTDRAKEFCTSVGSSIRTDYNYEQAPDFCSGTGGGGGTTCNVDNPSVAGSFINIGANCDVRESNSYSGKATDKDGNGVINNNDCVGTSSNKSSFNASSPGRYDANGAACGQCKQIDINIGGTWFGTAAYGGDCPVPVCGDGTKDSGEQCDDGNKTNGDGCNSNCKIEVDPSCGDGNLDSGEECDDGNNIDGDSCSAACIVEIPPSCGDGNLDSGEECDDGNNFNNDGCSAICKIELNECGDSCISDSECPNNHSCLSGKCTLNGCTDANCIDGCSPVCGGPCKNDSQCPNDHICNVTEGKCILAECANDPTCINNGCLPKTNILTDGSLFSDSDNKVIIGLFLITISLLIYKFNLISSSLVTLESSMRSFNQSFKFSVEEKQDKREIKKIKSFEKKVEAKRSKK
ncbi:MAG: DUF4215 domain-containing protein [Candidatus Dojkabacteria bacterium]|nr:DUF4215 domain-containing protein [Candidatus Dojkabacteria bacterium]MDQ7020509.1 DUF4215 domain-containing protein [Candidatus Dojkabacteria bacterium]